MDKDETQGSSELNDVWHLTMTARKGKEENKYRTDK